MTALRALVERWVAGEVRLAPIADLLGVRPLAAGDGEARIEMDAGPRLHNAMGILHGGVVLDLADVAMGAALATVVDEGETFATVSSTVAYLRPVREGRLTAAARVVHRGRTTAHLECDLANADGELVARVGSVSAIRRAG